MKLTAKLMEKLRELRSEERALNMYMHRGFGVMVPMYAKTLHSLGLISTDERVRMKEKALVTTMLVRTSRLDLD